MYSVGQNSDLCIWRKDTGLLETGVPSTGEGDIFDYYVHEGKVGGNEDPIPAPVY